MLDEQGTNYIMKLSQLLSKRLKVDSNPQVPRMFFVQKSQPDGNFTAVPTEELKAIIKTCLDEL